MLNENGELIMENQDTGNTFLMIILDQLLKI